MAHHLPPAHIRLMARKWPSQAELKYNVQDMRWETVLTLVSGIQVTYPRPLDYIELYEEIQKWM
jgi:hypothetical protein